MPEPSPDHSELFVGPEGTSYVAMFGDPSHPPVVLLHSGGMSGKQWRRAVSELRSDWRVIVLDGLGMGQSPPWPQERPFHFQQDVRQLSALLDRLHAPAHLVGHSYGGLLALSVARTRPVASVAAYEPAAFGALAEAGDPSFQEVFALSEDHRVRARGPGWSEGWMRSFVDYWNSKGAWDCLADSARAEYLRIHHKLEREVETLLTDRTAAAAYGVYDSPTLLMLGERSPRPARQVVLRLHHALPNAALEIVAGAGHLGPLTHARKIVARLREHLSA